MSEQSKEITILDAMRITMNILNNIPVRVNDTQTIAQPISTAVHNLMIIIEKMEMEDKANGQNDQDPGKDVER